MKDFMESIGLAGGEYESVLKQIGLSEKEAQIYSLLLREGQMGAAELLKLTPYKRGDIYNILYALRDKNIIEQTLRRGVIQFRPRDPYYIKSYLDQQQNKLQQASLFVESILPKMFSDYTLSVGRPVVRSYEGIEGLKKAYHFLNTSGERELLLMRSIYDSRKGEIEDAVTEQWKKQIMLGIRVKALTPLTERGLGHYRDKIDETRLVTRRFVDPKLFSLPAQILIWKNTVAIISLREKIISTVIENRDIATTMKALFRYIWETTNDYHKSVTWK